MKVIRCFSGFDLGAEFHQEKNPQNIRERQEQTQAKELALTDHINERGLVSKFGYVKRV